MKPNNSLKEYVRVMKCIDVEDMVEQRIIRTCARYGTLNKIKAGKYKVIAVKKEKISN